MHDSGQKKKLARREEMEQVNLRKNADEVFSQHEMEKARRQHDADKDRVRFLFAQTVIPFSPFSHKTFQCYWFDVKLTQKTFFV